MMFLMVLQATIMFYIITYYTEYADTVLKFVNSWITFTKASMSVNLLSSVIENFNFSTILQCFYLYLIVKRFLIFFEPYTKTKHCLLLMLCTVVTR